MVMLTAVVAVLRHWFTSICASSALSVRLGSQFASPLSAICLLLVPGSSRTMPLSLCVYLAAYPTHSPGYRKTAPLSKKSPPFPLCIISRKMIAIFFCSLVACREADSDFFFYDAAWRVSRPTQTRVCIGRTRGRDGRARRKGACPSQNEQFDRGPRPSTYTQALTGALRLKFSFLSVVPRGGSFLTSRFTSNYSRLAGSC